MNQGQQQRGNCAFCGKRRPVAALMPYAVKGGVINVCASVHPKTGQVVNDCEQRWVHLTEGHAS